MTNRLKDIELMEENLKLQRIKETDTFLHTVVILSFQEKAIFKKRQATP